MVRRFYVEKINLPVCKVHTDRIGKFRIIAENKESLFLCNECLKKLSSQDNVELQYKHNFQDDYLPDKSELFKSKSVVTIHQTEQFTNFGNKNKKPPLDENKRNTFRLAIHLAGKPTKLEKYNNENFLTSELDGWKFFFFPKSLLPAFAIIDGEELFLSGIEINPETFWE